MARLNPRTTVHLALKPTLTWTHTTRGTASNYAGSAALPGYLRNTRNTPRLRSHTSSERRQDNNGTGLPSRRIGVGLLKVTPRTGFVKIIEEVYGCPTTKEHPSVYHTSESGSRDWKPRSTL